MTMQAPTKDTDDDQWNEDVVQNMILKTMVGSLTAAGLVAISMNIWVMVKKHCNGTVNEVDAFGEENYINVDGYDNMDEIDNMDEFDEAFYENTDMEATEINMGIQTVNDEDIQGIQAYIQAIQGIQGIQTVNDEDNGYLPML
jgi:hypothetical protein